MTLDPPLPLYALKYHTPTTGVAFYSSSLLMLFCKFVVNLTLLTLTIYMRVKISLKKRKALQIVGNVL